MEPGREKALFVPKNLHTLDPEKMTDEISYASVLHQHNNFFHGALYYRLSQWGKMYKN